MNVFRLRKRLRDESGTPWSAAIRDFRSDVVEPEVMAHLEERLAVALATPVAATTSPPKPSWLLGLSMAAAAVACFVSILAHSHSEPAEHVVAWPEVRTARAGSDNVACYLGSGPRDLANAGPFAGPMAAMYAFHR